MKYDIPEGRYTYNIIVSCLVTIVVAAIVYLKRKRMEGSIYRAVTFSMLLYIILAWGHAIFIDQAGLVWMPLIVPIMLIYFFPMALLVSLGTIRILKDMKIFDESLSGINNAPTENDGAHAGDRFKDTYRNFQRKSRK